MTSAEIESMISHGICWGSGRHACRKRFVALASLYLKEISDMIGADSDISSHQCGCSVDDVCLDVFGGTIHLGGGCLVWLQSPSGRRQAPGLSIIKDQSQFAAHVFDFMACG